MKTTYVASSWRNLHQPQVVNDIRNAGLPVYDFRNPTPGDDGFSWSSIDPNWQKWSTDEFKLGLKHPLAVDGLKRDIDALESTLALVLVLPCGRSAHLGAGYAVGMGIPVVAYLPEAQEPELMYAMFNLIASNMEELINFLCLCAIVAKGK